MLDFAARHQILPQVEHFPMSRVNDALEHLEAGQARYRVVLDPGLRLMAGGSTDVAISARSPSATAYPLLTLTALMWAGNAVAGKWATGEVSPQVLTTLRWSIACAVLAVLARGSVMQEWRRVLPHWRRVILMGACGYMRGRVE